jgi:hypothetical protein
MANAKTIRKRNRRPKIGDIIRFNEFSNKEDYYLVVDRNEDSDMTQLLRLATGQYDWYNSTWFHKYKKVA